VVLASKPSRYRRWSAGAGITAFLLLSACSSSPQPSGQTSPGGTSTDGAGTGGDSFYVSLGDSLAAGYQPGQGKTQKGYVDDLWRSVRQAIPALELRKFGCPGETSRSLVAGTGSPCKYEAGSQLDAAVAFLGRDGVQVPFITIDIGVNDIVDECFDFDAGMFDRPCVGDILPPLRERLARIIDALRAAAGTGVPIFGMTYHNPFLGFWGLVPHGQELARAADRVFEEFNAELAAAYEGAGAVVADVAATFRIDDFTHTVVVQGRGRLPVNVALTCRWTWFCSKKHFGDPHANDTGYRKIARTFDQVLQPLLSSSG
jgi:lysophospholipase L1-like esterase